MRPHGFIWNCSEKIIFFWKSRITGFPDQEIVNREILDMNSRLSIPMVATNDCHYLDKDDVRAHDVLLCVQTGRTVNDADRFKFRTEELYFKSSREMISDFGGYPGAIENTVAIADRCHVEFDFKTFHFPKFDPRLRISPKPRFLRKKSGRDMPKR